MASIRLSGDDLVPSEVTALLGAEPSSAYARGDEIPVTKSQSRTARHGHWSLRATESSPADVDGQVEELLDQLSDDLGIWRQLGLHFRVDLFCGWFMHGGNEGLGLSPKTLAALGARGVELAIDVYGPVGGQRRARRVESAQEYGVVVKFIEDRNGRALVRLPNGSKTSVSYDALGRLDEPGAHLSLGEDEALVLYDWVHRLGESNEGWHDQAEQRVAWDLSASLERQLPVLDVDYDELLEAARDRVRDRFE